MMSPLIYVIAHAYMINEVTCIDWNWLPLPIPFS